MFKLKFKQKIKPNTLLCLTLRRKRPAEFDIPQVLFLSQLFINNNWFILKNVIPNFSNLARLNIDTAM